MKFSGVTLNVQRRYDLDRSFWTSSCEYEEWDSAGKLCYLLFSVTPLIGEVCLSQEQYEEFSKRGSELLVKLLKSTEQALQPLERQILSAAVVFQVQQADDDDDDSWEQRRPPRRDRDDRWDDDRFDDDDDSWEQRRPPRRDHDDRWDRDDRRFNDRFNDDRFDDRWDDDDRWDNDDRWERRDRRPPPRGFDNRHHPEPFHRSDGFRHHRESHHFFL